MEWKCQDLEWEPGFLEKTGAKTRKRQQHSEQELMREYD